MVVIFGNMAILFTHLVEVQERMLHKNIYALSIAVSEKNIFHVFFSILAFAKHVTLGRDYFWPQLHNLNKLGKGSLDDATYQISRL